MGISEMGLDENYTKDPAKIQDFDMVNENQ